MDDGFLPSTKMGVIENEERKEEGEQYKGNTMKTGIR